MGHLEQYDIDYQYIKPCDFADAVLVQSAPNIVGIASSFAASGVDTTLTTLAALARKGTRCPIR